MNLQQLEYIVAVDTHRHFAKAAEKCFVTQATLSMMIKKLETELGISIFDRSRQPVQPTEGGKEVIQLAREALHHTSRIVNYSKSMQSGLEGELRIGIIPTLAPYLLPLFLPRFLKEYSTIHLRVQEQTTDNLLSMLANDLIDVALLATPLPEKGFKEWPIFTEDFLVFVASPDRKLSKKYLLPEDIDIHKLWLLEEGHCLRAQVLDLCELRKKSLRPHNLDYETGSIESLLQITEINEGITIIPKLAARSLSSERKNKLRAFKPPVPGRQISLVTYRHYMKESLVRILKEQITSGVEKFLKAEQN